MDVEGAVSDRADLSRPAESGCAMDIARPIESSTLQVECPHCGQLDDDDLDVISSNVVYDMRCAGCTRLFALAVMDCQTCGREYYFGWIRRPFDADVAKLRCSACDARYADHEALTAPAERGA